ncbi:MAG: hypothetical protein AAF224_02640 [Pseudomonadota bacterium]
MQLKWNNQPEIRRYRRIPVDLPARAIINGTDERHGRIVNMSPGDLYMKTDGEFAIGDAAMLYVSGFDVLEGSIARVMADGFALSFRLSRARRASLTEKLVLKANPGVKVSVSDQRLGQRHGTGDQPMVCRLADGSSLYVKIVDASADAVAVAAPRKPVIGSDIYVGRLRGVVVRHTPRGFVVVYDHTQAAMGSESDSEGDASSGAAPHVKRQSA